MLDAVQAGAVGEHPAGKDPLLLLLVVDLVDLGEGVGVRRIGRRARIADARRHLQRAELHRLVQRDLEGDDAAGDLVEPVEHRDRIGDLVGVSRRGEKAERANERRRRGAPQRGRRAAERDHRCELMRAICRSTAAE